MLCLHSSSNGSCPRHTVEGSLFCAVHANEADRIKGYLINDEILKKQFDHHTQGDLYSLRGEIVLLRSMINQRLNTATNDLERSAVYREVGGWIATLDKLVNSLSKLEEKTSQTLTREALLDFARRVIDVVSQEVKQIDGYEKVIDAIAVRLIEEVGATNNLPGIK